MPQEFREKYDTLFEKKDTERYTVYKMLHILYDIRHNKYKSKDEIREVIREWEESTQKLKYYFFNSLTEWAEDLKTEEKENILFALELFKKHREL